MAKSVTQKTGISTAQFPQQDNQCDITHQTQPNQQPHAIPARPKLLPDHHLPATSPPAPRKEPPPASSSVPAPLLFAGGAGRGALALLGVKELPVALVAAVHGHQQDGGAVAGQQGADGVELGGEDL